MVESFLTREKYRFNYVARLSWSLILFTIVVYNFKGILLILSTSYLVYSILWAIAVELDAPLIHYQNTRYIRITFDAFFYTMVIYLTGGINSFLLLSYILFIMMASLYTTNRYGIYAIVICMIYYNAMLAMIYYNIIPSVNILANEIQSSVAITTTSVMFTNFILILVSVILHRITYRLYFKLNEKTNELQTERNVLKKWNELIEQDLNLARKIQIKLIPNKDPYPFIHSLYVPMEAVGGDFYDFIEFRESKDIGIFVSDVSGHGVHAAFITSMIKTLILQAGVIRNNPAELLRYLNKMLYGITADNFITAFYGIYNPLNHNITYASAGHNPPYVISGRNIIQLNKSKGIPLALENNDYLFSRGKDYKNVTYGMNSDDRIVLYTDGLIEEHVDDDHYKNFGELMRQEILPYVQSYSSKEIIDTLYTSLKKKSGKEHFNDDVCIICMEIH